MTLNTPPANDESSKASARVEYALLAVLILLSAALYFATTITVTRWNDPAVYAHAGLRLAETGRPAHFDANNAQIGPYFTLHGFKIRRGPEDPNFYPNHAIGLPLLIALARRLLPLPAAHLYIAPVLAILGLSVLFALGRALFGRWVGLLAAGLLAFNPVYWFQATENWSDAPAVAFLLAGVLVSLSAARRNSYGRGLLAGALLGYACLIRTPSALALAPLAAYLLAVSRGRDKPGRGWAGLLTGLGLLALLILGYNTLIFGGPLASGYSVQHGWVPWPALSWDNFLGRSPIGSGGYRAVLATLAANFHIGLLLALVGLIAMPRPAALLIGGNVVLVGALYAFYLWPPLDLNARFLLFAFPMICLALAWTVVRGLSRIVRPRSWQFVVALLLLLLAWHGPSFGASWRALAGRNANGQAVVARVQEIAQASEPDAVFLSQRYHDVIILYGRRSALFFALLAPPDPAGGGYRLDGYPERLTAVVAALLARGTPVYLIREPADLQFREGPIDPYPVLAARFELRPVRDDPPVYRVVAPAAAP